MSHDLVLDPLQQRAAVGDAGQRVAERGGAQFVTPVLEAGADGEQDRHAGRRHEHDQRGRRQRVDAGAGERRPGRGRDDDAGPDRATARRAARGAGEERPRHAQPEGLAAAGDRHECGNGCGDPEHAEGRLAGDAVGQRPAVVPGCHGGQCRWRVGRWRFGRWRFGRWRFA
jgi:hypothetical protein